MARSSSPRLVVAPWRDLAARLASDLAPRLARLRSLTELTIPPIVVVPGGGVAKGVQIELATRFPDGFVAPQFLTIERLVARLLSDASRSVISPAISRIAMDAAANAVGSATETRSLAALSHRSWRDAADSGVAPFELSRRADPQQRTFLRDAENVWRRYLAIIRGAGLQDPAAVITAALDRRSFAQDYGIVALYGFYDATGMQTRALRAIIDHGEVEAVYVPAVAGTEGLEDDYRFAERLIHDLGLAVREASPVSSPPAPVRAVPQLTPSLQRKYVCDAIAERLTAGAKPTTLAVVARSLDPVEREMWTIAATEREIPLESRATRPLGSYRIGRAIDLLLRIRDRNFQRNDVLELIDIGFRTLRESSKLSRAIASMTRERSIASGTAAVLRQRFRDDESEPLRAYINAIAYLEETAAASVDTKSAVSWADTIAGWVDAISVGTDEDIDAIEEIESWLAEVRTLGSVNLTRDAILDAFHRVEVDGRLSGGVFLGDFMEVRGRWFDAIWIVDAVEGSLPQGRVPDPLLPDDLRTRAGMRVIGTGETEERMLLRAVLDAATDVTIVWPRVDDSGGTQRVSPLVTRLLSSMHPEESAAILRDASAWAQARDGRQPGIHGRDDIHADSVLRGIRSQVSAPALSALQAHAGIGTGGRWDGRLPLDAELLTRLTERLGAISPTALEYFGACPHQFLVRSVLRISENTDPEDLLELDARDKGSVLHDVLERFYRSMNSRDITSWDPSRRNLTPPLDDLLVSSVDEVFASLDEHAPARFRELRHLEKADSLRVLREFLVADLAELSTSGFVPAHFEYAFGDQRGIEPDAPAARFEIDGITIHVRGTIDRVDIAGDGRVRIVDYKTTGTRYKGLEEKVTQGLSLQLAMYCRAWMSIHDTPAERVSAAIVPIRGEKIKRESLSFDYVAIAEPLDSVLSKFARSILGGSFPAIPGDHCDYCPVASACRERHDPETVLRLRDLTALTLLWPESSGE